MVEKRNLAFANSIPYYFSINEEETYNITSIFSCHDFMCDVNLTVFVKCSLMVKLHMREIIFML